MFVAVFSGLKSGQKKTSGSAAEYAEMLAYILNPLIAFFLAVLKLKISV